MKIQTFQAGKVVSPIFIAFFQSSFLRNLCKWNLRGFANLCMYQVLLMPRMKSLICNVIFVRTISLFMKNALLELETFLFGFPFCQGESPSARCQGFLSYDF